MPSTLLFSEFSNERRLYTLTHVIDFPLSLPNPQAHPSLYYRRTTRAIRLLSPHF